MTDLERRDVQQLLDALKRAEWAGEGQTCPVCRRLKRYGATHACSCPLRLALVKAGSRLVGGDAVNAAPADYDVVCIGDQFRFTVALLQDIAQMDRMQTQVVVLSEIRRDERGVAELVVTSLPPEAKEGE